MIKHVYKTLQKDFILFFLITVLIFISITLYVSLSVTSSSLKQNYLDYSATQNKNQFTIVPDYNNVDQFIQSVSFYDFDQYEGAYYNTEYSLDYDNIMNVKNSTYLTSDQITFIEDTINDDFINRIKNSNRPSYVIYTPIEQKIYNELSNLPEIYRNQIASEEAKLYTKILLLLTLNEGNYLKFMEFSLDSQLIAKDANNNYLASTIAYQYNLTIDKNIVNTINTQLNNKDVSYYLSKIQTTFNTPYVIESLNNEKTLNLQNHEIAIYQEFALKNNIKLGDQIPINNQNYKVVAFVYTPDAIYPIFNSSQYYYSPDEDTLVLMNDTDFQSFSNTDFYSIVYTAKFNTPTNNLDASLKNLSDQFKKNNILLIPQYNNSDQLLNTNIQNLTILSYVLSITILVISILFISLLLLRKLNQDQKQIGILKALGYHTSEIMIPYIMPYIAIITLGSTIGFISGLICSKWILFYIHTIFLLPLNNMHITFMAIVGLSAPIIITTIVNLIILKIKLHEKTVKLLNGVDTINIKKRKISLQTKLTIFIISLTILITSITAYFTKRQELYYITIFFILIYFLFYFINHKKNFIYHITKTMGNINIKKIISFNITIFMTAFLFLFIFYAKNVYYDIYLYVKDNNTYAEYLKYPNFLNLTVNDLNSCDSNCDGFVTYTFDVLTLNNKETNVNVFFGGYPNAKIMLKGIDTSLLNNSNVIITQTLADKFHLKINDTMTILTNIQDSTSSVSCQYNKLERCQVVTMSIADIANNPTGYAIYGNMAILNEWYYGDTKHDNHINAIYSSTYLTNDVQLSQHVLVSYQLKDILGELNHLFYTIVLITNFSFILICILSIIIMLLIMELTIKDNDKQIALLKSFGYRNNEIRKLLLSQYTPYLLMMFFLALPISYLGASQLFNYLGTTMNITLNVNIHLSSIFISFLLLILIYSITIYLSLLRIKRITLASWLNR